MKIKSLALFCSLKTPRTQLEKVEVEKAKAMRFVAPEAFGLKGKSHSLSTTRGGGH